jgi:hypothetical protein
MLIKTKHKPILTFRQEKEKLAKQYNDFASNV